MSLPLYFELGFLLTIYYLKTLWWLQSIVGKEIGILPIKSVFGAQHVLISGGENCFFSDDVGCGGHTPPSNDLRKLFFKIQSTLHFCGINLCVVLPNRNGMLCLSRCLKRATDF